MIAATIGLSGCVGGTTYGTGVSQEQETLEGVFNMFSLGGKKKEKIDYSARADLVIPSDKSVLREPITVESSVADSDWPESPEQKIARIRGEAVEPDERTGQVPISERLRKKEGIKIERNYKTSVLDEKQGFYKFQRESAKKRKKILAVRKELAYSVGPKRKFLTEPPTGYRDAATTAVAGDQGLDPEILKKRKREEEKRLKFLE
ncbi:MAG: hypothetical protein COB78_06805 [Hyphomicrobiales bacterium]|nr:MAG: hypothetical protein COB78_06805 [Hyphomicrobiales bacterium]